MTPYLAFHRPGRGPSSGSVGADGRDANGASIEPVISADGRHVAFASQATNLVSGSGGSAPAFEFQLLPGAGLPAGVALTSVVWPRSRSRTCTTQPSIRGDGRFLALTSIADGLVLQDGTCSPRR